MQHPLNCYTKVDEIKKFTRDERINKLMNNIVEISSNLKLTSREVRRAPWKLLYKPGEKEFRIQALVDSAGAFASGAEYMDATALRLKKMIEEAKETQTVDAEKINSMLAELEASFQQFKIAEKKFWNELE